MELSRRSSIIRTIVTPILALAFLAVLTPAAMAGPKVEGVRLVVGHAPASSAAVDTVVAAAEGKKFGHVTKLDAETISVPAGRAEAVLTALRGTAGVRYAEIDGRGVADSDAVEPSDPYWSQQWGIQRVRAPEAWGTTTGSSGVVVAVLDTGVNAAHPDLEGAVLAGRNVISHTTDTTDDNGHGTAVAGLIAGRGNNTVGIAGMCWTCKILPVKVMDASLYAYWSDVANGIVWAVDNGADVINMSLSGSVGSTVLEEAVRYAIDRGVSVVASAGNAGTTAQRYPAAYPGVVSVAASTDTEGRYIWSTYGDWVDVAAPGCNVTTSRSGTYETFCGTSSSAPVVTGAIGLMVARDPSVTATEVETAVRGTAEPLTWLATGRLEAADVVAAAVPATSEPISEPVSDSTSETGVNAGTEPSQPLSTGSLTGNLNVRTPQHELAIESGAGRLTVNVGAKRPNGDLILTIASADGSVIATRTLTGSGSAEVVVPAGDLVIRVTGDPTPFELEVTFPTN